jgi:hypothetical protein
LKREDFERLFQYYERGFSGVDKVGRPIFIDRLGMVKADMLVIEENMKLANEMFLWGYEQIIKHKFLACSALYD